METRASYVLVGVFVLGLIATAVVFVIWLGGGSGKGADTVEYRIQFRGDVTGLEQGAKVRFRGIPVGNVSAIGLSKKDTEVIEVRVAVAKGTPVRTDTRAAIESQGLTGAPFIQLSGPDEADPDGPKPLLVPKKGQPAPVIPGKTTGLARILEEFPKAVKAVTRLADRLADIANKGNRKLVNEVLQSASRAMGNLEKASRAVEPVLKAVAKLASKAELTLDDIRKFAKKADGIALGLQKIVAEVQTFAKRSTKAVNEIGKGAKAFGALSWELRAVVRENRRPIADFAATGLYEFSLFLTDMRKFVRSADRFIKRMENDPARFFFGNRQKGFTTRGGRR
jgi:phospholipid/cholesterol/gamma-HCH transport system substrate-binding protein